MVFLAVYIHSISKLEFFEEWFKHKKHGRNASLYDCVSSKFNFCGITEESKKQVKMKLASYSSTIATKWISASKSKERFLPIKKTWMESEDIEFHVQCHQPQPSTSTSDLVSIGRPRKDFQDLSFKTKKHRVDDLVQTRSVEELMTAVEVAVRSTGNRNVAKLRDISESSESVSSRSTSSVQGVRQPSGDEALVYYIDSKSTTHTYKQTRKWSMNAGHYVFPSYHCLAKSKKACYPSEDHIVYTETRSEINLQAVLDKTVERLIESQREVIESVCPNSSFILISKWGCDGSSGHSTYKQKFANSEDTDKFLFVFSFVPIRLVDNGNNIIWQNFRPSSTMFCRPIKFIFANASLSPMAEASRESRGHINVVH